MRERWKHSEMWLIAVAIVASVGAGWLVVYVSEPHYADGGGAVPAASSTTGPLAFPLEPATTTTAEVDPARPAPTTTSAAKPSSTKNRTPATTTSAATPSSAQAKTPATHSRVRVRVDATARTTFLCVEDGRGRQLYVGSLAGTRTFRGTHLRLNVGLSTTKITVNSKPVTLPESPSGIDVTHHYGVRPLAIDERPCSQPPTATATAAAVPEPDEDPPVPPATTTSVRESPANADPRPTEAPRPDDFDSTG